MAYRHPLARIRDSLLGYLAVKVLDVLAGLRARVYWRTSGYAPRRRRRPAKRLNPSVTAAEERVLLSGVTAVDDSFLVSTSQNPQSVSVDVLANDAGAVSIDSVSQPADGFASIAGDGSLTLDIDPGFVGTISFSYDTSGSDGSIDSASVSVHIYEVEAPIVDLDEDAHPLVTISNGFTAGPWKPVDFTPADSYSFSHSHSEAVEVYASDLDEDNVDGFEGDDVATGDDGYDDGYYDDYYDYDDDGGDGSGNGDGGAGGDGDDAAGDAGDGNGTNELLFTGQLTTQLDVTVTVNADGTWSYYEYYAQSYYLGDPSDPSAWGSVIYTFDASSDSQGQSYELDLALDDNADIEINDSWNDDKSSGVIVGGWSYAEELSFDVATTSDAGGLVTSTHSEAKGKSDYLLDFNVNETTATSKALTTTFIQQASTYGYGLMHGWAKSKGKYRGTYDVSGAYSYDVSGEADKTDKNAKAPVIGKVNGSYVSKGSEGWDFDLESVIDRGADGEWYLTDGTSNGRDFGDSYFWYKGSGAFDDGDAKGKIEEDGLHESDYDLTSSSYEQAGQWVTEGKGKADSSGFDRVEYSSGGHYSYEVDGGKVTGTFSSTEETRSDYDIQSSLVLEKFSAGTSSDGSGGDKSDKTEDGFAWVVSDGKATFATEVSGKEKYSGSGKFDFKADPNATGKVEPGEMEVLTNKGVITESGNSDYFTATSYNSAYSASTEDWEVTSAAFTLDSLSWIDDYYDGKGTYRRTDDKGVITGTFRSKNDIYDKSELHLVGKHDPDTVVEPTVTVDADGNKIESGGNDGWTFTGTSDTHADRLIDEAFDGKGSYVDPRPESKVAGTREEHFFYHEDSDFKLSAKLDGSGEWGLLSGGGKGLYSFSASNKFDGVGSVEEKIGDFKLNGQRSESGSDVASYFLSYEATVDAHGKLAPSDGTASNYRSVTRSGKSDLAGTYTSKSKEGSISGKVTQKSGSDYSLKFDSESLVSGGKWIHTAKDPGFVRSSSWVDYDQDGKGKYSRITDKESVSGDLTETVRTDVLTDGEVLYEITSEGTWDQLSATTLYDEDVYADHKFDGSGTVARDVGQGRVLSQAVIEHGSQTYTVDRLSKGKDSGSGQEKAPTLISQLQGHAAAYLSPDADSDGHDGSSSKSKDTPWESSGSGKVESTGYVYVEYDGKGSYSRKLDKATSISGKANDKTWYRSENKLTTNEAADGDKWVAKDGTGYAKVTASQIGAYQGDAPMSQPFGDSKLNGTINESGNYNTYSLRRTDKTLDVATAEATWKISGGEGNGSFGFGSKFDLNLSGAYTEKDKDGKVVNAGSALLDFGTTATQQAKFTESLSIDSKGTATWVLDDGKGTNKFVSDSSTKTAGNLTPNAKSSAKYENESDTHAGLDVVMSVDQGKWVDTGTRELRLDHFSRYDYSLNDDYEYKVSGGVVSGSSKDVGWSESRVDLDSVYSIDAKGKEKLTSGAYTVDYDSLGTGSVDGGGKYTHAVPSGMLAGSVSEKGSWAYDVDVGTAYQVSQGKWSKTDGHEYVGFILGIGTDYIGGGVVTKLTDHSLISATASESNTVTTAAYQTTKRDFNSSTGSWDGYDKGGDSVSLQFDRQISGSTKYTSLIGVTQVAGKADYLRSDKMSLSRGTDYEQIGAGDRITTHFDTGDIQSLDLVLHEGKGQYVTLTTVDAKAGDAGSGGGGGGGPVTKVDPADPNNFNLEVPPDDQLQNFFDEMNGMESNAAPMRSDPTENNTKANKLTFAAGNLPIAEDGSADFAQFDSWKNKAVAYFSSKSSAGNVAGKDGQSVYEEYGWFSHSSKTSNKYSESWDDIRYNDKDWSRDSWNIAVDHRQTDKFWRYAEGAGATTVPGASTLMSEKKVITQSNDDLHVYFNWDSKDGKPLAKSGGIDRVSQLYDGQYVRTGTQPAGAFTATQKSGMNSIGLTARAHDYKINAKVGPDDKLVYSGKGAGQFISRLHLMYFDSGTYTKGQITGQQTTYRSKFDLKKGGWSEEILPDGTWQRTGRNELTESSVRTGTSYRGETQVSIDVKGGTLSGVQKEAGGAMNGSYFQESKIWSHEDKSFIDGRQSNTSINWNSRGLRADGDISYELEHNVTAKGEAEADIHRYNYDQQSSGTTWSNHTRGNLQLYLDPAFYSDGTFIDNPGDLAYDTNGDGYVTYDDGKILEMVTVDGWGKSAVSSFSETLEWGVEGKGTETKTLPLEGGSTTIMTETDLAVSDRSVNKSHTRRHSGQGWRGKVAIGSMTNKFESTHDVRYDQTVIHETDYTRDAVDEQDQVVGTVSFTSDSKSEHSYRFKHEFLSDKSVVHEYYNFLYYSAPPASIKYSHTWSDKEDGLSKSKGNFDSKEFISYNDGSTKEVKTKSKSEYEAKYEYRDSDTIAMPLGFDSPSDNFGNWTHSFFAKVAPDEDGTPQDKDKHNHVWIEQSAAGQVHTIETDSTGEVWELISPTENLPAPLDYWTIERGFDGLEATTFDLEGPWEGSLAMMVNGVPTALPLLGPPVDLTTVAGGIGVDVGQDQDVENLAEIGSGYSGPLVAYVATAYPTYAPEGRMPGPTPPNDDQSGEEIEPDPSFQSLEGALEWVNSAASHGNTAMNAGLPAKPTYRPDDTGEWYWYGGYWEWMDLDEAEAAGIIPEFDTVAAQAIPQSPKDWVDHTAEFGAGLGDAITINITYLIRDKLVGYQAIDYDSGAYNAGGWTGVAVDVATGVKGLVVGAGKLVAKKAGKEIAEEVAEQAVKSAAPNRGLTIADDGLHFLRNGGCFVPGTPVRLSAELASVSTNGRVEATTTTADATPQTTTTAIENVALGARVPDQNPRPQDYDFRFGDVDEITWRQVDVRLRRKDGALIEMQLLRPAEWIESVGLVAGSEFTPHLSDIEVDGQATVTAISPCPEITEGEGSVVTGRFVTRKVNNLVEVTLENGTTFTGTTTHPVWVPGDQEWVKLGDLEEGQQLESLAGPLTVVAISQLSDVSDVFNIEVHGHHVYRITEDGVLVHNNCLEEAIARGMSILRGPSAPDDLVAVMQRLGRPMDRTQIGEVIHKVKADPTVGLGAADDLVFDFSGGLWNGVNGEYLGKIWDWL